MPASVLIVEDEPSVREILSWRLSEEGYQCEVVSNAHDALQKLESGMRFEIMMSDIRMPGLSGVELLTKVREIEPDMAVVMVTAGSDVNTAINTLRLGAFDYITKPFGTEAILNVIERAINFAQGNMLEIKDMPLYLREKSIIKNHQIHQVIPGKTFQNIRDDHEKDVILAALNQAGGNKAKVARNLDISRSWLYEKITRLGLDASD